MKPKQSKYDLVVVGTGFASTFFLKRYLEKNGQDKKILVLERGLRYPYTDRIKYRKGEVLDYIKEVKGYKDCISNPDTIKPWVFEPNFGGGSNCWWGVALRFMPNDFKTKTLYGVAQDWPIGYDDIDPYYDEAEKLMSISGPDKTPYPKKGSFPLPPHVLTTVDRAMQRKFGEELYFSQPTARASTVAAKRGVCCTSYSCSLCPTNAKFTIENTFSSLYEDPRIELLYQSQVTGLVFQNDQVKKVVFEQEGKEMEVEGELVALGANAIFNAHILLASNDSNRYTGKGISEQKGFFVTVYLDNFPNVGGSSSMTANGYMLYDGEFRKQHASIMVESHNGFFIRNEHGKWRNMARFKFVFEDLPEDRNFVSLSEDRLKPKINFVNESAYVDAGRKRVLQDLNKILAPLPVESLTIDEEYMESEYHILGTTRMSKDAATGVVDDKLIHHQYRNLFVLGGGSFPSITAANPSLTIAALSLRSADLMF
ncbi:GMC oxidoreductase [Chryseosolibacter indicus]|uniref:GMC family oxidoreductase n=1 Tax=Chryseosolibacter indicus TaxID=2782351 RepID=A0ABS5VR31_9BACT|nr:GMC family oxidoreductase [Chryseosolibacter indicus]MBT1703806.1 GMC family oxidoreductase [Chryseosolibacter indicus]